MSKPKYYCKVCFDNSKSIKEYTSHNVRNEVGKVCCPLLMAVICAYCGIKGHGPKYCTRLATDKKKQAYAEAKEKSQVKKKAVKKPESKSTVHPLSKFSALEMSSESESEAEPAKPADPVEPVKQTSKPAYWANASSEQERKTRWAQIYDSDEEEED